MQCGTRSCSSCAAGAAGALRSDRGADHEIGNLSGDAIKKRKNGRSAREALAGGAPGGGVPPGGSAWPPHWKRAKLGMRGSSSSSLSSMHSCTSPAVAAVAAVAAARPVASAVGAAPAHAAGAGAALGGKARGAWKPPGSSSEAVGKLEGSWDAADTGSGPALRAWAPNGAPPCGGRCIWRHC